MSDDTHNDAIARWLIGLAGIAPLLDTPAGVEVTERWQDDRRLLFVLNHTGKEHKLALDGRYVDLLRDCEVQDTVSIAPRDVLVLLERTAVPA